MAATALPVMPSGGQARGGDMLALWAEATGRRKAAGHSRFYGAQYASMAPLFEHYGIQLWTRKSAGGIDFPAEDHEETMLALGVQSKREIVRTRIRVRTAMATQTREQGRYLGGRPP